jgi:hypothetical protein
MMHIATVKTGIAVKTHKSISRQAADAHAQLVLQFWRAGRNSLERISDEGLKYGHAEVQLKKENNTARREFASVNLTLRERSPIRKMRAVAREISEAQINRIVNLVRAHRSRFAISNLVLVLALKDKSRLMKVVEQAIKQSWSARVLKRSIQALNGQRRPAVGRQPQIPTDPGELLAALDASCDQLLRWLAQAEPKLPSELLPAVKDAIEKVTRLKDLAAQALARLKKPRPSRHKS